MNYYICFIKKINLRKIFLVIFLSFFTMLSLLLSGISKEKKEIKLQIKNPIEIEEILINNNEFLGIKNDFKKNKKKYYFKNDKKILINKTDCLEIIVNKKYVNDLKINSKKLLLNKNNGNDIIYKYQPSYSTILFNYIKTINIFKFIFSFIFVIIFNYILLSSIDYVLNSFIKRFSIKKFIIFTFLIFILYYFNYFSLLIILRYLIIIPILLFIFLIIYKLNKHLKFEHLFIILLSIFSISMLFSIPPFNIPDEGAHFYKSYDHLFYTKKIQYKNDKIKVPDTLNEFYVKFASKTLDYNFKLNPFIYFEYYNKSVKDSNKYIMNSVSTMHLMNLAYIPSNIGLQLCKLFNFPILFLYMFGRYCNMLIYLLLCILSLKNTPKYKYCFMLVMALPITIQQSIGYNQDCINNALFFASLSYIFKFLYQKNKISNKDLIIMTLLYIGLIRCKILYALTILFLPFINKNRFKNKYTKYLVTGFIILFMMFTYFKPFSINKASTVVTVSPYYTLNDLVLNPFNIIKIYYNTFKERFLLDMHSGLFNGFGWSKIWISNSFALFIMSNLLLILILTLPYEKDKVKNKLLFIGGFILLYLAVGYGLLTGWTNKKYNIICGLQPRYYIPSLILLYSLFNNKFIKYNGKNYNIFFIISISIIFICSILFINKGFYQW